MGAMATLSDDEVRTALVGLTDWQRAGDEIIKTFALPSFPDAIAFVTRIGFLAERADHHPDLDIRWRNVRVALSTHSEHGITQKDVALAGEIEALVGNG
jgi:4a-hydroxytetrahydrobiopterin dehydratase